MTLSEYRSPTSLEETFGLLGQYGEVLVGLGRVAELRGVEAEDGGVRIGALTTHREAETSALIRERLPVLADTLRKVATVRIRNVGTLGGNLAHADPSQDPPVTLIALGASVELASASGERVLPLEEFFTDYYETALQPGELVKSIGVPGLPPRSGAVYQKFLPRTADDYATVSVAALVSLDEAGQRCQDLRVALGSVGATPVRARRVEAALRGQPFGVAALREAAALVRSEVDPISDIRGSAEYKRDMAELWVRRTLAQACAQAGGRSELQ